MKKIVMFIVAIFIVVGNLNTVQAGSDDYDYDIIAKSDNSILAPGDQVVLWATLQNKSHAIWYSDWTDQEYCGNGWCDKPNPIRLGTIRPTDRSSMFYTPNNWLSSNRVHVADQDKVGYLGHVNFGFYITAPDNIQNGVYTECFAPVIENSLWLADKNLCWDITIDNTHQNYDAKIDNYYGAGYKKVLLEAGQTATINFELTNTGNTTWQQNGNYPVHLATVGDNASDLYHSSWLNINRPAKLLDSFVLPGNVGHFELTIVAPIYGQVGDIFEEEFWLVAENLTWFNLGFNDPVATLVVEIVADQELQQLGQDVLTAINKYDSLSAEYKYNISDSNMKVNVLGTLEIDNNDAENELINADFALTASNLETKENYDLSFALRQKNDSLTFIKLGVADLTDLGIEGLEEIDGQWIRIDEQEIKDRLSESISDYENLYLLDPTDKQIDPEMQAKFDQAVKYSGALIITDELSPTTVNNHDVRHLKYELNYTEFMRAISLSPIYRHRFTDASYCGDKLGEANINCIVVENIYEGEAWVGKKDNLLYKLTLTEPQSYSYAESLMTVTLDNYGDRFTFVEPDEYLTLDDLEEIYNSIISASPTIQSTMEHISRL